MDRCHYHIMITLLLLFSLVGYDTLPTLPATPQTVFSLHIEQKYPLSCPVGAGEILSTGTPSNNLVLNDGRVSYDTGAIQQITSYLNGSSPQFPARFLSWIPGGLTGIGQPLKDRLGCGIDLQLSNDGTTDIQILQVQARLLAASSRNTYKYRLIDICPIRHLESIGCQTGTGGTSGDCYAIIHLDKSLAGTLFENTFKDVPNCINQVINPGDTLDMQVTFYSPGADSNSVYNVSLEITVESQGKQYIEKPTKALDKLVFARNNQFSCYRLQDNTFQQIVPGSGNPALCV